MYAKFFLVLVSLFLLLLSGVVQSAKGLIAENGGRKPCVDRLLPVGNGNHLVHEKNNCD